MESCRAYIRDVNAAAEAVDADAVAACVSALEAAYRDGRQVFIAGNGGSAANASHFAQDLSKGALLDLEKEKRFRVLSLADNMSFITALSNDIGYDRAFDLQLRQFAQAEDVLILISGSGNSPNILNAARFGREAGLCIVAVTGFDGGALMPLADIRVHVPLDDMCKCEAVHGILFHYIVDELRNRLHAE